MDQRQALTLLPSQQQSTQTESLEETQTLQQQLQIAQTEAKSWQQQSQVRTQTIQALTEQTGQWHRRLLEILGMNNGNIVSWDEVIEAISALKQDSQVAV